MIPTHLSNSNIDHPYLIDLEKNYTLYIESLYIENSRSNEQGIITHIDIATITFLENDYWLRNFDNSGIKSIYFFYPKANKILCLNGCVMTHLESTKVILSFMYSEFFEPSDPSMRYIMRHINLHRILDFS